MTNSILIAIAILALLYVGMAILALLGLLIFPFVTILECANSTLSRTKKSLWILAMLLFWPLQKAVKFDHGKSQLLSWRLSELQGKMAQK